MIQITRSQVVEVARSWIDTPFKHQGRIKGQGCDCLGLIVGIAKEIGACDKDYLNYPEGGIFDFSRLTLTDYKNYFIELDNSPENPPIASILQLWVTARNQFQHLAIISQLPGRLGIIHANVSTKKVVEHTYSELWQKRVLGIYDFRNIEFI